MMSRLDLRELEVVVGRGKGDVGLVAGRLMAAGRHDGLFKQWRRG